MTNISADLAWALGMVPECLVPCDEIPQFRDEYGSGWFWFEERYEGPRRLIPCRVIVRTMRGTHGRAS